MILRYFSVWEAVRVSALDNKIPNLDENLSPNYTIKILLDDLRCMYVCRYEKFRSSRRAFTYAINRGWCETIIKS